MKFRISWHVEPLYSFDFSREYHYIGFDLWRVCVFFRYRKYVAN